MGHARPESRVNAEACVGYVITLRTSLPNAPPCTLLGGRLPGDLGAPTCSARPGCARGQPRVGVEPHGAPPAVADPDLFPPQPPELGHAFTPALHDPLLPSPP